MASPVVAEVTESSTATAGTNHVVTHPTVVAGQLWLLLLDKGSTSASVNAHADWTELLDEVAANGLYIAYRWTTGSEGASTTLVTSASTRSAQMVYRITGAENPATTAPQIGTTATGTSATPDPPASATPPSSKDYLFIAFFGKAGEEADDDTWVNTPPASYTPSPPRQKACGIAGTNLGGMIGAAERTLTTGVAQNPGTFGVDVSTAWRAQTITVHPSTSAPVTVTPSTLALVLATFAAVVTATANVTVTPGTKALSLSTFAPTVTATDHKTVTPGTAALSLETFAPTVTGGGGTTVTPGTASLTTSTFSPIVSISDNQLVTPGTDALSTNTFAPTVTASANQVVTPDVATLTLTTFTPVVTATGEEPAAELILQWGQPGGEDPSEIRQSSKRREIIKPTGLLHLPVKARPSVQERVDDSAGIAAEVAGRIAREFSEEGAALAVRPTQPPVVEMSLSEIEAEIGLLLRKKMRTEEDELLLLLLTAAAAV